uniref:solute carrier family 25 member 48-like n=1 Tax=Styela clava TaxID=7725 RepID=UPI00193A19F1|nr:solute carrier family 25 member 48-like [Styela clava]
MPSVDACDFLAGWIGGAAGVKSSHPLDTVKVRLQTSNAYKGTIDCCIKIMHKEGPKGFFKGMSFPLLSVAGYNALVFGVYSNTTKLICQWRYNDANHQARYSDITFASMIAGAVSVSIGAPVDLVKIRLQTQTGSVEPIRLNDVKTNVTRKVEKRGFLKPNPLPIVSQTESFLVRSSDSANLIPIRSNQPEQYRGVMDCLLKIYKKDGLRGFYKGGGPAMLIRDIPGYVVYFLPYTILCNAFKSRNESRTGPIGLILAGGLAGVLSWGIMHPVDTVKSRIQLQGGKTGVFECAWNMYRKEGLPVFFRGLGVNALRGFPQSAALFFGYEMSVRVMRG